MIEEGFNKIYTKFKLHFYQAISKKDRENDLTIFETLCMEGIIALGNPTAAEFGRLMNLSTPNVAYKVNNLVKKGYLERVQSTEDKREVYLHPTQKYLDKYNISYSYLDLVVARAKERFNDQELKILDEILKYLGDELMPEIELPEDEES